MEHGRVGRRQAFEAAADTAAEREREKGEEGNHYWRRCCFGNTFLQGVKRERERITDRPTATDGAAATATRR